MTTFVIQIGNSDDKLTQQKWHQFIHAVERIILSYATTTHFNGDSSPSAPWQNHCWVIQVDESNHHSRIINELRDLCAYYDQDSIAVTRGTTEFITPGKN